MGIEDYSRALERFTWREQRNSAGEKILSLVYHQSHNKCAAFAISAAFEARLRLQSINTILSKDWIDNLYIQSPVPRTKVWLILKALRTEGAIEDDYYMQIKGLTPTGNIYRVRSCEGYDVKKEQHLLRALKDLVTNGPLVAVFKISKNYHDCVESKHVYRFDPNRALKHRKGNGDVEVSSHAACVVGFGNIEGTPCLECQDSRGKLFSTNGFLYVDITSVVELYSLYV